MKTLRWWQTAVFYQIYPRSFSDGNGDGIGDLKGILAKLDYLKDLGIDAIWLSPYYPSPQADCGYDISDYTDVDPDYGTLALFKEMLEAAHARGLRIIIDLVLNHTSDQHPWFIESRANRDNPKRDWYIWHDGKNGGPPNNWESLFGGSAWELDSKTGQYYYHYFLKEQPDLNWRNPDVKAAMFDAIRFWLDLGVDGFRLDAIDTIFEHPDLPDNEVTITQSVLARAGVETMLQGEKLDKDLVEQALESFKHQVHQPGIHELFREIRTLVDTYDDRVLVGETDDIAYYGNGHNELHMAFNFPLINNTNRLAPGWIRQNQVERLGALPPGAWPCNTLSNHDRPRVFNNFGDKKHDLELARLHLALMLTLKGTPFLYNGEEIGMTDLLLEDIRQFKDRMALNIYQIMTESLKLPAEQALMTAAQYSRDRCRTPMQWANIPNGGFSPAGVITWLPVNPNYASGVNVAEQEKYPDSLLNFYRTLLSVRKKIPALLGGDYEALDEAEDYLAFLRTTSDQRCLVVLNFSEFPQKLSPGPEGRIEKILFSTAQHPEIKALKQLSFDPFEIFIAALQQ